MKVFFDPRMSVDSGGFSPSGSKPAAVVADWLAKGLDIEISEFNPVTVDELCLAHDRRFVLDVLAGRKANGHGNTNPAVTESTRWTCGSMVAAARQAMLDGITCSPSSGFHHSHRSGIGPYCTWNGLIVAAEKLRAEGLVKKVGIIDCDAHEGDGTAEIIDTLGLDEHIKHWTFGGVFSQRTFRQVDLLGELCRALIGMKSQGVDLILYQAGCDVHVDDPLGAGVMTTEEMRERDRFIFETCIQIGLPVAFCLAGGYSRDEAGTIAPVLGWHRTTMMEAIRAMATTKRVEGAAGSSRETLNPGQSSAKPRKLVIEIAAEGSGCDIFSTTDEAGNVAFHSVGSDLLRDECDDSARPEVPVRQWATLEGAIVDNCCREWILLTPLFVDPEFREIVWQLVLSGVEGLSTDSTKRLWTRRESTWAKECGIRLPNRRRAPTR